MHSEFVHCPCFKYLVKVNLLHAEKQNQGHNRPQSSVLGETIMTKIVIRQEKVADPRERYEHLAESDPCHVGIMLSLWGLQEGKMVSGHGWELGERQS